jgi:hypothetical protein
MSRTSNRTNADPIGNAMQRLGMNRMQFAEFVCVSPKTITRWRFHSGIPHHRLANVLATIAHRNPDAGRAFASAHGLEAPSRATVDATQSQPGAQRDLLLALFVAAERMNVTPGRLRAGLSGLVDDMAKGGWTLVDLSRALSELSRAVSATTARDASAPRSST